ncbi:MAG TPA: alpha-glucosidase [Bacteroidales bacterium]|nr:alpha-glucosidase [Bacteroidales bacterium]
MKDHQEDRFIWWKHGVIYHIYPRSFQDSDGDGIGDLRGIIRRIDYLRELGVDAIWLSPVLQSPMVDFGYDISDYRVIDSAFGSHADFADLIRRCHSAGIRVILDMVLNHTSSQHPWFKESASGLVNGKRDWYIWRDGVMGGPPNNWTSAVGGSAWTRDECTGQYYLHSFFREQPDLNWRSEELAGVVFEELKFWLDQGVDGFRLDVINMIAKDRIFRNNPGLPGIPALQKHIYTRNRKRSLTIVKRLRKLLDSYGDCVGIGEIYTLPPGDPKMSALYLGEQGEGLHLTFDFSLIFTPWNAHAYYDTIVKWYESIPTDGWPSHVLSNHDLLRSIDRLPLTVNREKKAKVAATLLMTLRGTPFIYYGEEIGMHNGTIPRKRIHDPLGKKFWPLYSGRDKARTPMQWNDGTHAGFTDGIPWLPVNKDISKRNVRQQEGDPDSLLNHYRRLIRLRKTHKVLQTGEWVPVVNGKNGILAYFRKAERERILVVLNFTGREKALSLPEHTYGKVLVSTLRSPDEYSYFQKMKIGPYESTVWLVIE